MHPQTPLATKEPDIKKQSMVVVLALLLGSSAFLNILFFLASIVAIIYLYHKRLISRWNIDRTLTTNVRSYTYKELEEATRGFRQTVGKELSELFIKESFHQILKDLLQSRS